ncbi:hypothetical protein [Nocardia sp. NPDC003963]
MRSPGWSPARGRSALPLPVLLDSIGHRITAVAARIVAGHSTDAADCRNLLAMLGLDAEAGKLAGIQT